MSEDRNFDRETDHAETHAHVQWKGTDVCMDFQCECGESGHFDGYFAYAVKCAGCGTRWEMPSILFPRKTVDPDILIVTLDEDETSTELQTELQTGPKRPNWEDQIPSNLPKT